MKEEEKKEAIGNINNKEDKTQNNQEEKKSCEQKLDDNLKKDIKENIDLKDENKERKIEDKIEIEKAGNYNNKIKEKKELENIKDLQKEKNEKNQNKVESSSNNSIINQLTEEEKCIVNRIKELGNFSLEKVVEAFIVCNKNEELTANYLFEQYM